MPFLQLPDLRLHYQETGGGEPLLFIHGLGGSADDWAAQVPPFADRYRVIGYDVRGHGRSEKPKGPYSIDLFAEDARRLLEVREAVPAHIVGLSMGGMIAFQLAVSAPEVVRSLTIVNSGPALVPRTLAERLAIFLRFATVRIGGLGKMGAVLAPRLFPAPEQAGLREEFLRRFVQNDRRAYLDTLRALVGWSVLERISQIDRPVLVAASDQDYTPVSAKEAYARRMPNARVVVIPGAHHAVSVECPEAFNAVLETFLAELRPAAAPAPTP